jgi:hypothetical protein
MRDLGPNARNLIELARHEDEPDEAARERVQDALLARMKAGAAGGSLASPGSKLPAAAGNSAENGLAARGDVQALAAAKSQLGLKGGLAIIALFGAGGALTLYSERPALLDSRPANGTSVTAPSPVTPSPTRSEAVRASQHSAEMVAALQPSAGRPSSGLGKATAAQARPPSVRSSTTFESAAAGRAAPDASSLEPSAGEAEEARVSTKERGAIGKTAGARAAQGVESAELAARNSDAPQSEELLAEARALRDAQQALRAGDSSRALTLLAEQERRFAGGQLGAARAAARAMALCESQGAADRRSTAARFVALWPRSPLLPSVRAACSTESTAGKSGR